MEILVIKTAGANFTSLAGSKVLKDQERNVFPFNLATGYKKRVLQSPKIWLVRGLVKFVPTVV